MLLTITYEGQNTQDLGYLLHKNPARAQQFALNYGKAYVFYPEVGDARTTAALLLDIDPIDLARGKVGSGEGGLFDYVNDRPYASTSFMSTAIARVFGSAMNSACKERPALSAAPLDLTARLTSLRDNGEEGLAEELFAPLGYRVETRRTLLDDAFPAWGKSPYIDLTLQGRVRLCDLLNHLYVLIPVFDGQKHYYMAESEIGKLLDHGEGWLASHPAREKIARRYFRMRRSYVRRALDQLLDGTEEEQESDAQETREAPAPLNAVRLKRVRDEVLRCGAKSVLDLGCGEGRLTAMLLREPQIARVTACDVSVRALERAAQRLEPDRMPETMRKKLTLMQASLTYRDDRFKGYDCACVVEVIEHIDRMRIPAFERSVFEFAAPQTVIVTTPNREYNALYPSMEENGLRHGDHRFEWTRAEFERWTEHVCTTFGYRCTIGEIGEHDERAGSPTQMGVFTKYAANEN